MSWLDIQTSFYKCQADNIGRAASFRDILLTQFAVPHDWFYRNNDFPKVGPKWITGNSNDVDTIINLRNLDKADANYKRDKVELKAKLQAYTPAAVYQTKKKDGVIELSRTGIMQLDFDYHGIKEYDIEDLKRCVFDLPFIGFCGLSCGGNGFFALALIAEPYRLAEYAEHLFVMLGRYGIQADETKGPKPENLRYISYDANMLIRENPEALKIKNFLTKPTTENTASRHLSVSHTGTNNGGLVYAMCKVIKDATEGNRWDAVGRASVTLGGTGDLTLLDLLIQEIQANPEFSGQESKYNERAEVCFKIGLANPLPKRQYG